VTERRGEDRLFSVRDRVVVVTGAGRGIGRVLALAFAERGAHVALASRTLDEVEQAAAACRALGVPALAVDLDLRLAASAAALVERTVEALGRIDVLINNAGVFVNAPAVAFEEADWDLMIDTNLKAAFFCARAAGRAMIAQGSGRIVNVSSALASVAQDGYACYGASKAGLEQITRVLALEWARYGITVNAIAPTTTATAERPGRLTTPEALQRARERVPLGRYGQPDDLVGAAVYLASDASSFMTGQVLRIDGGFGLTANP
jgi:NAD(P)-dependent dehydrogenase (short-subunit alcohol dehydrogenase family)